MSKPKVFSDKHIRVFLLVIIIVPVLLLIALNIGVFGNVLLVLLGFGAVVLVHEFGHFVLAKLSDIKVEAFSIFMPPILLGVRKTEDGIRFRILPEILPKKEGDQSGDGALSFIVGGKGKASETEYRVGLIPFGGFVKMLGQDDTGPVKNSDDPRSYANKPIHTRAAVLAAGVVFNVISAVIIFMIAFLIGIKLPPAVVGGVLPNSPAARAGLRAGDEIIEIAGKKKDLDFSNIALAAALSGRDEKVPMKVRHEDGSEEDFVLVAEPLPGEPMRGFGILASATLTIGGLTEDDANDLCSRTGLLPGDRIVSVNGKPVATHWQLSRIIKDALVPEVTLLVERIGDKGKTELIESQVQLDLHAANNYIGSEPALSHIYSIVPRLRINSVSGEYLSVEGDAEPRLKKGDIILAIGDVENPTYTQMRTIATEHEGKQLSVRVLRTDKDSGEQVLTVTVVPKRQADKDKVMIGIIIALDAEHPIVAKTITADGGPPKLDIPSGASITAVDGVAISNYYDLIREIRRYPQGDRVTIDWRLNEQTAGNVVLDVGTGEEFITVKSDFAEFLELIPFKPLQRIYKASGPVDAVLMGYRKTVMFVAQAYLTLKRLLGGLVSPKSLMGPVGIITFSYRIVAEQPLVYYVYFLGLISAVIAVFNFLPLPPLDGGLVLLLLVEKAKGSALSERMQTIIAYTGWTLILTLILYVTFNDILRSFFGYRL